MDFPRDKESLNLFNKIFGGSLLMICLLLHLVTAYSVTPPDSSHQYISKESQHVWSLISSEIEAHLTNSINRQTSDNDYNLGDDVIDGSREEDLPLAAFRFLRHFWQPDNS